MESNSRVAYLHIPMLWLIPLLCFLQASTNHAGQLIPEIPVPKESRVQDMANLTETSDDRLNLSNDLLDDSSIRLDYKASPEESTAYDSGSRKEVIPSESIGSAKNNSGSVSPGFLFSDLVVSDLDRIIRSDPVEEEIPDNTLLLPNRRRDVPDRGFPDETKEFILKLHNLYRGNVTPPAGNMMVLEWDTDLEHLAQLWADGCDFKHGKPSKPYKGPYGQNLYIGTDPTGYKGLWMWYYEYNYYDLETLECEPDQQCGHYVTMAWAESTKVGCGVTKCGLRYLIVCHYFPAPLRGQKMYTVGRPCSQCPNEEGSLCLNKLCVTWEQCDLNPKLCDDAECNLKCRNCGQLDKEKCRCNCADGWDSPDCSRLCIDEHERCGVSPGFPNHNSCSLSKFAVAKRYCRKMCQSCNTYENDTESDNVCCDGKLCDVGEILDTESCRCKMLCPGLKCNYMDPESGGESLKITLLPHILFVIVIHIILYMQSVIIK